jgi:hypothetical protein
MDFAPVPRNVVGTSPYGPDDEIGRLNLITPDSRQRILSRVDPARIYDLSVDYFMGMPTWVAAGDPNYQIWMSHSPPGHGDRQPDRADARGQPAHRLFR